MSLYFPEVIAYGSINTKTKQYYNKHFYDLNVN